MTYNSYFGFLVSTLVCFWFLKAVCNILFHRQYSGTWFEIKRYPNSEQNGQCNRAVYELLPGGDVSVLYSEVVDERLVTISGRAVANKYGPGSLQVDLNVNNGELY